MKPIKNFFTSAANIFRSEGSFDLKLLLVFGLINGLVLVNAILHDPQIGYDAIAHLKYVDALSHLRLVTPQDTNEFFSPPLPYIFPALVMAATRMLVTNAAKLAQYLNVLLSVGLTLYLIKTCELINPRSSFKLSTLIFLGILPVYYKTFAFVRGEPFVAFFAVVTLYYSLLVLLKDNFTTRNTIILGTAMGLCALSRQWGFFLFPPVFLLLAYKWFRLPQQRPAILKTIFASLTLIVVVCGWFYLSLHIRYGSITAFNRESSTQFTLTNQPKEFFIGVSSKELFSSPVRPNFQNQFIPIFYSELWGDYWCYFSIYAKNGINGEFVSGKSLDRIFTREGIPDWLETNYEPMSKYLGRVNLVAIFPSIIALTSLVVAGLKSLNRDHITPHQRDINIFLVLIIGTTMVGYFLFLVMYPNPEKGDTIKASYVLQIFPTLAILVGLLLDNLQKISRPIYYMILTGLCLCFVHNLPAMVTHFRLFNFF